jgi:hypothetical protein
MYFKRFYGSGYQSKRRDPREKVFAEYVCSVCGHVEDKDVSRTWNTTFQPRDRRCPACQCMGDEDRINNLKQELAKHTVTLTNTQVEIERITRELEEAQAEYEAKQNGGSNEPE